MWSWRSTRLSRAGVFDDIASRSGPARLLGLCGLVGAGRSEVARVVFGIDKADSGTILINGKPARIDSPRAAMDQGIALVPEDRHGQGLVLDWTITTNASLAVLRRVSTGGLVSRRRERRLAKGYVEQLKVKCAGLAQPVQSLSGRNQQKIVARQVAGNEARELLILDEPTRGVDIGTKAEVHRADLGPRPGRTPILMISSESAGGDRHFRPHPRAPRGPHDRRVLSCRGTQESLMAAATGQVRS